MRGAVCLIVALASAACANANIQIFFTAGSGPYGLTDPDYAFTPTNGNQTDVTDGNWQVSNFPSAMAPATVAVGETAYIWFKFAGEPNGTWVRNLYMSLQGPVAECAWYILDDRAGEMAINRWDGAYSPGAPEFKTPNRVLTADAAYGLRNLNGNNAGWLYRGGTTRTYLLGAARYAVPGTYSFNPGGDSITEYGTVTVVPEPCAAVLLAACGVGLRRR